MSATVRVRREVRSGGSPRISRGRAQEIPLTSTMEQLPPESMNVLKRPISTPSKTQLKTEDGCDSFDGSDRWEEQKFTEYDEVKCNEEKDHEQEMRRRELEEYLQKVRDTADLGEGFDEKVKNEELAWKEMAMQEPNDDKISEKIEKGMKRISKLDKKLEELEEKERQVAIESSGALGHEKNHENSNRDLSIYTISESDQQDNGNHLKLPSVGSKKVKRAHLSKGGRKKTFTDISENHISRNIELAPSAAFHSKLTSAEEERIEKLLLEDEGDINEAEGKTASDIVQERCNGLTIEDDPIQSSLKKILLPDEWETRSAYFFGEMPDDTEDACSIGVDGEESDDEYGKPSCRSKVGPLLSARSASSISYFSSGMSVISGQTASTERRIFLDELRSKREEKERLDQIEAALENIKSSNLITSKGDDWDREMKSMVQDAKRYIDTSLDGVLADREKIAELLKGFA